MYLCSDKLSAFRLALTQGSDHTSRFKANEVQRLACDDHPYNWQPIGQLGAPPSAYCVRERLAGMCVLGGRRKFRGVDNLSVSGEEYVGGWRT